MTFGVRQWMLLFFVACFVSLLIGCSENKQDTANSPEPPQPPKPEATPKKAEMHEQIKATVLTDGDRQTSIHIHTLTKPKKEREQRPTLDFPPGAPPFIKEFENERLIVVRFPEIKIPKLFSSNGYGILEKESKQALLIDPGVGNVNMIRFWLQTNQTKPIAIAVTHGHLDHTGGVRALKEDFPDTQFLAPKGDASWIRSVEEDLFKVIGALAPPAPDRLLEGGDQIEVGDVIFDAMEVPGHTEGSLFFVQLDDALAFTGDAVFSGTIGRTDLKHALDKRSLIRSIKKAFDRLPGQTQLFPGHGAKTSIEKELRDNPFLHQKPSVLP